jgi:hypothetical protein
MFEAAYLVVLAIEYETISFTLTNDMPVQGVKSQTNTQHCEQNLLTFEVAVLV